LAEKAAYFSVPIRQNAYKRFSNGSLSGYETFRTVTQKRVAGAVEYSHSLFRRQREGEIETYGGEQVETCWASTYCKAYPNACSELCPGHIQLKALYQSSGMPKLIQFPKQIQMIDPVSLKLRNEEERIVSSINQGRWMYLWGTLGGKTLWASRLMNRYFREIALSNDETPKAYFVSFPTYVQMLREQISDEKAKEQINLINRKFRSLPLIVVDGLLGDSSDWVRTQLYYLLQHRRQHSLSTLFTSRFSPNQLRILLGDDIGRLAVSIPESDVFHFSVDWEPEFA
jgi:hypothetical protein